MASFYFNIIVAILLLIPIAESSRCAKHFNFTGWQLNSAIPCNLYPSSNDSNNNTNEDCRVFLTIDVTTGLVNGRFSALNQSNQTRNQLDILTVFPLTGPSTDIAITYTCSMSDYCDIDFLRETLASTWPTLKIESVRQEIAARLYNSNNTGPVSCSDNKSCPSNTLFCSVTYLRTNGTSGGTELVDSRCTNLTDTEPIFVWQQSYTPVIRDSQSDLNVFYCNIPNCGSNNTVIETFRWLTTEYVLPLNISILQFTTTTSSPTTTATTTPSPTTTTRKNSASNLLGQLNIVILCFLTILFFH